jgi:hypothetical protein
MNKATQIKIKRKKLQEMRKGELFWRLTEYDRDDEFIFQGLREGHPRSQGLEVYATVTSAL